MNILKSLSNELKSIKLSYLVKFSKDLNPLDFKLIDEGLFIS